MNRFCAYCFGPLPTEPRRVTVKGDRSYHRDCAAKDTAIHKDGHTLPGGVRIGGRGADWIAKYGGPR